MTTPAPMARPRDPARSLRAIGAAILGTETVVVALAIPVVVTGGPHGGAVGVAGLAAIAVLDVVLAMLLRRRERLVVVLGSVVQVGTLAAGVMSGVLLFLAFVFAGLWAGWLVMRKTYHDALRAADR